MGAYVSPVHGCRRAPVVDQPPTNAVAYVAALAALVPAAIHLSLAPRVMGFDQTQGVLFYLNGLGFAAGVLVLPSRYWRREFSLVAAGYSRPRSRSSQWAAVNQLSVASKAPEVVVAASLYGSERPARTRPDS